MRAVVLCILMVVMALVCQAQTNVASLNITLTDVQSVTFSNATVVDITEDDKEVSPNSALKVLSGSTSQVKKISSKSSEYEKIHKEFSAGKYFNGLSSSSTNSYSMAVNSASGGKMPLRKNISNLVIYQIDPR